MKPQFTTLADFKNAQEFIHAIHEERRNDEHWKHVQDMFEGVCHVCLHDVVPKMRTFEYTTFDFDTGERVEHVEHVYQMTCERCGNFVEVSCDSEGCVIE